jgi:hypothetical protein
MTAARKVASAILHAVARHLPPDTQDWCRAMIRELDFIDSDWTAVSWALGSTTTLFRQSVRRNLTNFGRRTGGLLSGVAIGGGVFVISAGGVLRLLFFLFPAWRAQPAPIAEWLTAIVMPEIVFIVASMVLWRQQRFIAAGIVLAAITLMIHFAVHVAAQ